jgi:site-specific DNA recombinase
MAKKQRQARNLGLSSPNGEQRACRVATLTRISTDETNQPYSLEAQSRGLDQYVGSQPNMEITHRYVDQASGATLQRPGLQAALAAARAGEFDAMLVYRIDRLTRSIVGLMHIVEELDEAWFRDRSRATELPAVPASVLRNLLAGPVRIHA